MPDEDREPVSRKPLHELLRFGTAEHRKLVGRLHARRQMSENNISGRYEDWDRSDEHVRLVIDLARKARRADKTEMTDKLEMPFERAVVVPMSLAVLQVRLTALMAIFFARDPVVQYDGRGPEDVRPAKVMEAVVAYDLAQMVATLALYTLFQDAEKYGIGVLYDTFESEPGWVVTRPRLDGISGVIQQILERMGFDFEPQRQWGTLREFNQWTSIDPFFFWPDPRVPLSRLQEGEFIGHRTYRSYMWLVERSRQNDGPYFNIEFATKVAGRKQHERLTARDRFAKDRFGFKETADDKDKGFFAVDPIQIKLIPRDWGLSPVDKPQIWWFAMLEDSLVIRAHPSRYDHGKFTYAVAQPQFDEHSIFTPGTVENLDGIQRVMNWLVNSHVENIRRFLNDAMIYGPSFIEETDVLNPGPARHIRLTRKGEELVELGRLSMNQMITQLPIQDVTAAHLNAANVFFDMGQRMTGVNDPTMGQPTDTKRTLGEIERIIFSAGRRMATTAQLIDAQAVYPLSVRAAQNRQQFTTIEQYVKISGELVKEFGERLLVNRSQLQGNFDYIPTSGLVQPDPARFAEVWVRILQALGRIPQVLQPGPDGRMIDLHAIVRETIRVLGVKNVNEFFIHVQPDALIQDGLDAGNMVPSGEAEFTNGGAVAGGGIQTPTVPVGIDLGTGQQ